MEFPEGEPPNLSENISTPTASTSEVTSYQGAQRPEEHGADIACNAGAEVARDPRAQIPVDHGAQADADCGAQAAAKTTLENLPEGKEMSKSQNEPPHELENQFILRLPPEYASTVRKVVHSGRVTSKDELKIDLYPDGRHAIVEVEDVSLTAKLVDLPCVIGSLKTLDKKNFYKTADISQMLVCTADGDLHSSPEEPVTSADLKEIRKNQRERQKKYVWKHGITPPLKNVRKKRFRKTTKKLIDFKQIEEISFTEYIESPDVEKEVKRLLCSDAEAVSARWEVIAEDETKEIESQGTIPVFDISPGMIGHEQGHVSSECDMLREMFRDSSSNSDEDDEDDDKEEEEEEDEDDEEEEEEENEEEEEEENDLENEEEEDSEEDLERELQAKFIESGQFKANEETSSTVLEIQKQIHYMEMQLQEIQGKAQRQEDLIVKVENLTLKSHLQSVLEQLKLQENEKNEQLISLREQLKYFLEK
ncbi:transcription initiation factor TFIID subunit 7-like [Dasypus novemcinctus]|uniref:transcription initiation factor TFIID subunit 7-like n=1 Tax=Dasypus novemcinctus TaxID=9361 RepID=UPI0003291B24|nr:transcription initiation factor TFIID subunit 7-like [Dasypus novemcinctus]